jgi:aspartyl-tRNA(Asn)/glutamyl-tRNA(Gln) amidotransferase subunit B
MNLESALLKYEPIIGIEIHAQLNTKSKAYCGDGNEFGAIPNTRTSPVSLGHPGTLPKFNKEIINHALKLGLALDCEITRWMHFDRKNYFYADLPKGYQITQDKTPICRKGQILIRLENNETKNIELTRIHMEEDSGKSIHDLDPFNTLIDLNRAGVPLLEIVTEPVIRTSKEAYEYVTEIRKLLRYLEICDGNMEEGSMRCDVNISIMPIGSEKFGDRVEVKNLNSIRNVQRSIDYEIVRQAKVLGGGEEVKVETRTFDAPSGKTSAMRKKEAAHDYRYFPEPDLNPIKIEENHLLDIKSKMPALPNELFKKFTENYGLSNYDALVIIEQKEIAQYFEQLVQFTTNFKTAANWVMVNIKSYLNQQAIEINSFPVSAEKMGLLIQMIDENLISNSLANQKLFPEMIKNPNEHPQSIAEKNDWISSDSEEELLSLVTKIIDENPSESERLKNGEKKLIGFFMGKIMKASNGTADPKKIAQILNKSLSQ